MGEKWGTKSGVKSGAKRKVGARKVRQEKWGEKSKA